VVDARNAGPAAAAVVQNRLGDFEPDAQVLQAGGNRSPQIVNASRYYRRGLVPYRRRGSGMGIGDVLLNKPWRCTRRGGLRPKRSELLAIC
jgi:hypothetical protein